MSPLESSGTAGTTRVRILLVEDNEAASKGLARLLEASGYDVTSATTGEEALAHLQGSPPDFLLTDLQLPDIDGRELALKARELSPPPRVILITGWDVEADEQACASWGVDCLLTKPLDIQSLLKALRGPESPD